MNVTDTVLDIVNKIEAAAAQRIVNRVDTKPIKVGEYIRQGDVYLVRVRDDHARGAERQNRQIADGTSIGSRHAIAKQEGVRVYENAGMLPPNAAQTCILGPVVVVDAGVTGLNTHPEHCHFTLPSGVYQVVHQMDPRSGSRVQD